MNRPTHNDAIESLQQIVWSLNKKNSRLIEVAEDFELQIVQLQSQLNSVRQEISDNNTYIENYSFSIKSLDPEYDQWFVTQDPIEDL